MKRSIIIGVISLLACDLKVEDNNISLEKLISVTCFISPQDSVFTAYVFRASPLGSTIWYDSAAVKDALVTVSDGHRQDTLYLASENRPVSYKTIYRYEGKKKNVIVSTGETYFLSVTMTTGEAATGSCTIPPAPGAPVISGTREDVDYRFAIRWTNPSWHPYFVLVLDAEGAYDNPYPRGAAKYEIHPNLLEFMQFPSDDQVGENHHDAILRNAYLADNPLLKVYVRNIDEASFRYLRSFQDYEEWNSNHHGNIFPNFREVRRIYSNIQGGTGLFGGYNQSAVEIAPP